MIIYLAGPMSGIPQFNFPEFNRVAAVLREQGYEVVNPAELDHETHRKQAELSVAGEMGDVDMTWGEALGRDVTIVADEADAVALLPNWDQSRGAPLEVMTALLTRKPVYTVYERTVDVVVTTSQLSLLPVNRSFLLIQMQAFVRSYYE